MVAEGFEITWPPAADSGRPAPVARTQEGRNHHNTLVMDAGTTFVFWGSPLMLAPAKGWRLHAVSVPGRHQRVGAEGAQRKWEHYVVAGSGRTDFHIDPERTYSFYLTPADESEETLTKRHLIWPVYVYNPDDAPEGVVHIVFEAQPFIGDGHGREYAGEFDLSRAIGTVVAFGSLQHFQLADEDSQKLIDTYALNGLIDGGALIKNTSKPVEEWDILLPSERNPATSPYGPVDAVSSYHWHYIVPRGRGFTSIARREARPGESLSDAAPPTIDTRDTLWHDPPVWTPEKLKAAILAGEAAALSLGDLVMLAGDFFLTLDEMHSSTPRQAVNVIAGVDAEKRLASMIIDVALLPHSSWARRDLGQKDFMDKVAHDPNAMKTQIQVQKVHAITDALRGIRGPTRFSEIHALAQLMKHPRGSFLQTSEMLFPWCRGGNSPTERLRKALKAQDLSPLLTKGIDSEIFNMAVSNGQYGELALKNAVHFSPQNWVRFEFHLEEALSQVARRGKSTGSERHPIPAEAVALVAFGLHFLTDAFSAGHMRVPREALGVKGALAAKLMHDMDGYYGLVVRDQFGHSWRAFGDDNLRTTSLDGIQRGILEKIKASAPAINPDADENWNRARDAIGAAFKQLHYEAQRYYKDSDDPDSGTPIQRILHDARKANSLMWDDCAPGPPTKAASLKEALKVPISGKIEFMRRYRPLLVEEGTAAHQNHPPLFLEDGTLNKGAGAYGVDRPSFGLERVLFLKWHGVTDKSIQRTFSKFYYLAMFTNGASGEGWISDDETVLVRTLDGLPDK